MESKYDDDEDAAIAEAKMSKLTMGDKDGDDEEVMRGGRTNHRTEAYNDEDDDDHNDDPVTERKRDMAVEREWKQARLLSGPGRIAVSNDPTAEKICQGLVINYMNMRCAETGELMWQSPECGPEIYTREQQAHIPAGILNCSAVSREINFSSREEIKQFRLEQRVFLDDSCIEEWLFTFGYVIPGSTNTWQQTIEAADPGNMLDPDSVSGRLTIETAFYDAQMPIAKTVYRIFYE